MATLKLREKPAEDSTVKVEKPPVRPTDPAKRSRTKAPAVAAEAKARAKPQQARPPTDSRKSEPRKSEPGKYGSAKPAFRQSEARSSYIKPPKALTPDSRQSTSRPLEIKPLEAQESTRKGHHHPTEQLKLQQGGDKRDLPGYTRPSTQRPAHARRDAEKRARNHPYNERPASAAKNIASRDSTHRDSKFKDTRPIIRTEYAERTLVTRPSQAHGDETAMPRLSKRMAELGLCSRREADEWISNGWVSVDGVVIDTLGTRIAPDAKIEVSNAARKHQSESVTIILHKPIGYVSGQAEDGYQPAIVLIHPDNQWDGDTSQTEFKRGHLQGLAPAGRLDIDSTGLLVFTQDGRVARQLIGEDSTVEKEYLVRVEGELSATGLKLLNHGLELDGVKLKPAKVSWQNEDQLRFVLREGRKRQIRRMCELVGLTVVGLKRVRIGSVTLGKLPLGSWRYLQLGERF